VESATTLMTGHVNVGGFFKVTAGQSAPAVTKVNDVIADIKKSAPEVDFISQRGRGWAKVVSPTHSIQLGIAGVDIDSEPGMRRVIQVVEGSLDALKTPGTMLIFEEQAKKLAVKVGDPLTISAPTLRGVSNTTDVQVGAIARNVGLLSAFNVFVPNVTLRKLYQYNPETAGAVQIYLHDIRDVRKVEERLRVDLAKKYEVLDKDPRAFWFKFENVNREPWTGQKLDVTTWEDEISFIKFTITAIQALGNTLLFILLVIIAVGIMNTLWIAIRERTREIGTLRAIGMQRRRVISMFLTEAFLLSAVSTFAGVIIGIVITLILNASAISIPEGAQLFLMRDRLLLALNPAAIFGGVVLIISVTTGISLIPSFLAARLKPITAMSSVG
jgi:ABC-type lipoprotein release transport system permease subunit